MAKETITTPEGEKKDMKNPNIPRITSDEIFDIFKLNLKKGNVVIIDGLKYHFNGKDKLYIDKNAAKSADVQGKEYKEVIKMPTQDERKLRKEKEATGKKEVTDYEHFAQSLNLSKDPKKVALSMIEKGEGSTLFYSSKYIRNLDRNEIVRNDGIIEEYGWAIAENFENLGNVDPVKMGNEIMEKKGKNYIGSIIRLAKNLINFPGVDQKKLANIMMTLDGYNSYLLMYLDKFTELTDEDVKNIVDTFFERGEGVYCAMEIGHLVRRGISRDYIAKKMKDPKQKKRLDHHKDNRLLSWLKRYETHEINGIPRIISYIDSDVNLLENLLLNRELKKGNVVIINGLKYRFDGKKSFIIDKNAKKSADVQGKSYKEVIKIPTQDERKLRKEKEVTDEGSISKKETIGNLGGEQQKIAKVFGEKNPDEMESDAEEIKLRGGCKLKDAITLLLEKKAEGIKCYINFNGTILESDDINSIDDGYKKYLGKTKSEFDEELRKSYEEGVKAQNEQREREKGYAKKIAESREGKEIAITMDNVIAGLKFIAEHPKMKGNELVDNLINLGCNFTLKDINKQYPNLKGVKLFPGMAEGNISCGATVIAWCTSDGYADERFFAFDHKESAYAFIRKVTGDETYTKEYVDSLINRELSEDGNEDSREGKESIVITKDAVVAGLKFMAEHPKMKGNELVNNLINLGCNFTLKDINKQYPNRKDGNLFSNMAEGKISCGAIVIAMSTSYGYFDKRLFASDNQESVYAFIRKVTGDETYTKEYVDSLINRELSEDGEIPQELKDFRKKWKEKIRFLDDDKKNAIINAVNQIPQRATIEPDGSRLVEFQLGGKKYQCLDVNLAKYSDPEYLVSGEYNWQENNEVILGGMMGNDTSKRNNRTLAEYVEKEKNNRGMEIPTIEFQRDLINELGDKAGLSEEKDKVAMWMYLTGNTGMYWLTMGSNKSSKEFKPNWRSGLYCDGVNRHFDYYDIYSYNGSLCLIACK